MPTVNRIRPANGPIIGERHLRNVLQFYAHYHNQVRTRLSIGKDAPVSRSAQFTSCWQTAFKSLKNLSQAAIIGTLAHLQINEVLYNRG